MSTRSAIIEKIEDGYRGIYCHSDGYLSYNGQMLLDHYQDAKKVSELIDLGDISSLNKKVVPTGPHSFNDPEDDVVVAYYRDRGEEKRGPWYGMTVEDVVRNIAHNGYVYVFADGQWFVDLKNENLVNVPLARAIKEYN